MGKKAEDLKKAIESKLDVRTAEEAPEEETKERGWTFDEIIKDVEADELDLDGDDIDFFPTDNSPYEEEEVVDVQAIEDAVRLAGESGYEAFRNDVPQDENPFASDDDITEALEEEEVLILQEAWNQGWVTCSHDFWMSQVVLIGKELVECTTAEAAQEALKHLEYATDMLGQTLDYDDYRAYWDVS